MARLNLLNIFLRLSPLALGAIAVAILVLGYYLQLGENARAASHAATDATIFGLLSKVAGVIGLLALVRLVIKPEDEADEGEPETTLAEDPRLALGSPTPKRLAITAQ